jgi:hypothetical protein
VQAVNRAALSFAVLLAPLLAGCQDRQARADQAALAQRVTALEAQVRGLKDQGATLAPTLPEASEATARAAAGNCATALARALETYRSSSLDTRYPTRTELAVPDACAGQRVEWTALEAQRYAFRVLSAKGQELARQNGP